MNARDVPLGWRIAPPVYPTDVNPLSWKETFAKVRSVLVGYLENEAWHLCPDSRLKEDLKLDSLDVLELCHALAEEFGVTIEPEDIQPRTLGGIVNHLEKRRRGVPPTGNASNPLA